MWRTIPYKIGFCEEGKGFGGCRNTRFSFVGRGQRHKRRTDWFLRAFVLTKSNGAASLGRGDGQDAC